MALTKLVAGNWKMNGLAAALGELDAIAAAAVAHPAVDVAVCPPFTLVAAAASRAGAAMVGGQDCHIAVAGAYTGSISAEMLADAGATCVIVGHSERRRDFGESNSMVRTKAEAAQAAGLLAIVCVGETEAQRDAGDAEKTVTLQLGASLPPGCTGDNLVVAYEPLWAIGTGRTPSLADIGRMHGLLRAKLIALMDEEGARVRILYGGSARGDNAGGLMSVQDVDGLLVGGASLTADQFVPIIEAAAAIG